MTTPNVKKEGDAHVVYNAAETVQMGTHKTAEGALAHAGILERGTAIGGGLARTVKTGDLFVVEGGRYVLNEDAGDLARMSDGQLRKLRATMAAKKVEVRKAQAELAPANTYGTPEGSALFDDLYYYGNLISRLEAEMACRMITLD